MAARADTDYRWLTAANALSASRVAMVPVAVWSLLADAATATCAVFAWVIASDLLDGALARRAARASPLGTLIDHGADATFVTALAGFGAWLGVLPVALPALIALAFVQYVLDSRVPQGGALRRSRLGRWNGIAYFAVTALAAAQHHLGAPLLGQATYALGWVLVATTLASMLERARRRTGATGA